MQEIIESGPISNEHWRRIIELTEDGDKITVHCIDGSTLVEPKLVLLASNVIADILEGDASCQEISIGYDEATFNMFLDHTKYKTIPGHLCVEEFEETVSMASQYDMQRFMKRLIMANLSCKTPFERPISFEVGKMIIAALNVWKSKHQKFWLKSARREKLVESLRKEEKVSLAQEVIKSEKSFKEELENIKMKTRTTFEPLKQEAKKLQKANDSEIKKIANEHADSLREITKRWHEKILPLQDAMKAEIRRTEKAFNQKFLDAKKNGK